MLLSYTERAAPLFHPYLPFLRNFQMISPTITCLHLWLNQSVGGVLSFQPQVACVPPLHITRSTQASGWTPLHHGGLVSWLLTIGLHGTFMMVGKVLIGI